MCVSVCICVSFTVFYCTSCIACIFFFLLILAYSKSYEWIFIVGIWLWIINNRLDFAVIWTRTKEILSCLITLQAVNFVGSSCIMTDVRLLYLFIAGTHILRNCRAGRRISKYIFFHIQDFFQPWQTLRCLSDTRLII